VWEAVVRCCLSSCPHDAEPFKLREGSRIVGCRVALGGHEGGERGDWVVSWQAARAMGVSHCGVPRGAGRTRGTGEG
jgi:hypothetical protein